MRRHDRPAHRRALRDAPFEAVAGNNDDQAIRERCGRKKIVEFAGTRIGMIHGDHRSKPTEQYAFGAFADERVDAIVFGHSHGPVVEERAGIALIDPGSPADKRFKPLYSYAILEVADGKVETRLHYYLSRFTGR